MVLPLLISSPSTPVRYGNLGRTVLQCLHVIHFMEQALSLFHDALGHSDDLEDPSSPPVSPHRSLSAFDAHVGDCACQTRAQMCWDLVMLYRKEENKAILPVAIAHLKKIKVNTALLLEEIELGPRNSNLTVLVNHMAIWERIDFLSFLNLAAMSARETTPTSNQSTDSSALKIEREKSTHRHRDLGVDADWDPLDVVSVTRFLTMCHLLSEFKIATIEAGLRTRVRVRVDLRMMYERNARELEGLGLTTNKGLNYHIKSSKRMSRQIEVMQIYVSRATADWAKQTAIKEPDRWSSFPEEFIATNERRILCVSSYASFLLVRDAWINQDIPIFSIIQHFCSHGGYRNTFCRITRNPMAEISKNQFAAIGEHDWFKTQIISLDEVGSAPWSRKPHIVGVWMSCQGTIEDFRMRLLESQQGLLPLEHRCGEADDCAQAITRINMSRLFAHFFAQHQQFPFLLREDETKRVASALHDTLGEEAEAAFMEAKLGADEFGTGRSSSLGTLEHIFMEYPDILAREVKEYGERPRLLGYKLERARPSKTRTANQQL